MNMNKTNGKVPCSFELLKLSIKDDYFLMCSSHIHSCLDFILIASSNNEIVRTLFLEKSPINPLATITNDPTSAGFSTSPNLSVTDAQKRIANFQKKQFKRNGTGQADVPARNHVQEMQRKVREKINTPVKARKTVESINIPMNKVNELKKQLNESKMQELKKLEDAQMNSKKRAEISDRVNTVTGLLESLKGDVPRNRTVLKTSKGEELSLPRDRVRDMKNWLKDSVDRHKAHADKWNTASVTSTGRGGAYIPRIGARNQPFELENNGHPVDESKMEVDSRNGRRVSDLTGWLDEFGKKNKNHFEQGSMRPTFEYSNNKNSSEELSNVETYELETSQLEDVSQAPSENNEERVVENTSFLDNTVGGIDDLNISTMPVRNFADTVDDVECDWEDDYNDLMIAVDIERIDSKESWDKDSVVSPRDLNEEEPAEVGQQENCSFEDLEEKSETWNHQMGEEENEKEFDDEEEQERADVELNYLDQTEVVELINGEELERDDVKAEDNFLASDSDEECDEDELIFHCDDSFSVITSNEFISVQKNGNEDDSASVKSGLVGEHLLTKIASNNALSSSYCGNRITDTSIVQRAGIPIEPTKFREMNEPKNRKKKGISKFLSSLICMKSLKTSKAAEKYTEDYEEDKVPVWNQQSSKSLFLSPDSHLEHNNEGVVGAYLPNGYNINSTTGPSNFPREMLMNGTGRAQVSDSPMSLASAFRRQMSPGSSCMSGFTDVETRTMTRNHDIGQHVMHLKSLFSSPVRKGDNSERQLYQF